MDTNANNNRESFEDQQVIFVDTHLIQKAVEGLQRAREEFQTLLEQAEGGDASVYYDLGVRYTEGDGTDKDPAQAARWFALASEDGDLRATDLLGRCYQSGAGVEKDEARAAELFQQAAEQDYAPAQCDLGLSYENGSGVEKDEARAAGVLPPGGGAGLRPGPDQSGGVLLQRNRRGQGCGVRPPVAGEGGGAEVSPGR